MTVTGEMATAPAVPRRPGLLAWVAALAVLVALWLAAGRLTWLVAWPDGWIVPLRYWISDAMHWLVRDATFGLFTFKEFTRAIAWVLNLPLQACLVLLSRGFEVPLGAATLAVPPLSWLGVLGAMTFASWRVGGRRLALLVGLCFGYLVVFGQWNSAMVTLSSILVAVPLGIVGGALLGIAGYRNREVERAMTPILDLMQTVPVFAYLIPVLFLFGFGPVSAMIATIVYALPPMVRITILALRAVPAEVVEFGRMAGCTERQMLWKVLLPSARYGLMVGVNQVIMLSLNMVIIASMIGAGGLGHDVLAALRRLAIGAGLEAGVAITVLAISLDRLGQAIASRGATPVHVLRARGFVARHGTLIGILGILAGAYLLAFLVPALRHYPDALTVNTGPFFDKLVEWVNVHLFTYLDAVKSSLLIYVLIPFKRFLVGLPWPGVALLLAVAGWRIGGPRLAALVAALAVFVAVTGNWEKAMISAYLCGISVVVAMLIGLPVGILAAGSERIHRIAQNTVDTLQTLPSFVYLIPVVMLFQVGDFSAMIAIVAYAVAPAVRYTDHGIRGVPGEIVEAARMAGCRRGQLLWKVQIPLALPEIMLGVNQTIMMALSMLVISALVGTRDLGQEVYIALTRADTGHGLVAGLCVACIAIVADRLIGAWAARRREELGMEQRA
ncbi:glycine betaine/proline transport system permease protein [Tistlia consotensis]|uniref:Glycine betaine/proline transport system permease protein n=1 Tax=Tistlia consotensis USBA 355 TaxID=560819 RepID=A0A1Y6BZ72_9PROT|nr:ABC transporter permease subunit [Tistlia consotensis]SMF36016.1 glycine betaine/proline transport system permease protein [Tistlia consotensis USBA 355]SNR71235.1 glycine betaine/proline transport system permease protein [Tistlia consotensis]